MSTVNRELCCWHLGAADLDPGCGSCSVSQMRRTKLQPQIVAWKMGKVTLDFNKDGKKKNSPLPKKIPNTKLLTLQIKKNELPTNLCIAQSSACQRLFKNQWIFS